MVCSRLSSCNLALVFRLMGFLLPADAIRLIQLLVSMEIEAGRTIPAARLEKQFAELCEELSRPEQAIDHYRRAADLFRADESKMSIMRPMRATTVFEPLFRL